MSRRIAVLGCGTMAGAIVSGLLAAGTDSSSIIATARSSASLERIRSTLGVTASSDNRSAVQGARIVLLGVKPAMAGAVLAEVADALEPGTVIISIAAGVSTTSLSGALAGAGAPEGLPVVRVMPNTPVKVGQGTFIVSAAAGAQAAAEQVRELLAPLGTVVELPETLHDAATAISGSGPAYIFLVAEAMIDAGVTLGIPRAQASELTIATMAGSASLMARTGEHPAALRNAVTSPGGSTAAALDQLESHRVRTAFARAIEACCLKAAQLGEGPH